MKINGRNDFKVSIGVPAAVKPLAWDVGAERLADAVAMFLRSREAIGCTAATLRAYRAELAQLVRVIENGQLVELTTENIEGILANRRTQVKPISVHRTYRTLRTFCRWCARTGRLAADPMDGIRARLPKTLPRVPTEEEVRALLRVCSDTPEGRRNRLLIALAADSGLRKEELRCLRIADVDTDTRQIRVIAGKGQKDGVGFFGETTASLLRLWLAVHPDPRSQCFMFVTRAGQSLGVYGIARILHRLSDRAGLPRRIGPHALRHYAATAILRRTGDLELTRRVLRHETLAMTLRYAVLAHTEIAARYRAGSPLDHLSVRLRQSVP